MATYLQGVTDTGFNSVTTTPNLPYLMNALQKVTARYEKNYNDLSNQYSKITNSLLLNPENNEFRNKFLENSKDALKTLSTSDLSVQSNIDQAEQIFSPFWEDKDMLADYAVSKAYQQQKEKYLSLKNSDKKEERDQAWDMGLAYVNLTASEMALAKRGDGSIQNVQARPYISNVNINKELFEELKNLGFENGVITKTYAGNGYIKTITNGKGTKQLYTDVLQKIFKNRLDLRDWFKVQGVTNFQSTVFERMKEDPSLSREEVEFKVKDEFATRQVTAYDKQLENINEQLNGSKDYKGLIRDIDETQESIYNRIDTGVLSMDSTEAKSFFEKLNKKDELIRVKASYEEKINNLKSDDFKKSKGEDYFTTMFMDQFIDDNSSSREAAISEKMTSDSGYASAMNLNERINEYNRTQQEKENKEQQKQNGVGSTITIGDDGQIVVTPNSGEGNKKIKSKEKTASELLDVPVFNPEYSSNAKDLETSSFYNFKENQNNNSQMAIDAASTYLNLSGKTLIGSDISNIKEYIDYLTNYTHGGKPVSSFNKSNLEGVHKALLDKKIITAKNFLDNAPLQLNQLVEYVDRQGANNTNLESIIARSNYNLFSKYYLEADNIEKEFYKQYKKEIPDQKIIKFTEVDKNKEYKFITAQTLLTQYKKGLNATNKFYGINTNPNDIPPVSLIQDYMNGVVMPIPVKKTINAGTSSTTGIAVPAEVTVYNKIIDPKTKLEYNIDPIIKNYGRPEDFIAARKTYEESKGIKFSEFVSSNSKLGGKDWIMSNALTYRNNPDDAVSDKSAKIALDALAYNKGTVIKGGKGVIKPLNFKKLADDSYENEMIKVLEMLFNNKENLNASLISTDLKYQGVSNNLASVKLNFELKKLQEHLIIEGKGKPETERLKKAIQVLATNGLEFSVSKDIFRKYAKDNYMHSALSEKLLKGGDLTATDYEKKNFHYDYRLTLGANDKMLLTYKISSYDTELEGLKEKEESIEYPITIGIDNVLKDVRELGITNGIEINKFLKDQAEQKQRKLEKEQKQQKEKNAPNSRQPGESLEDWKKRIELQGKKMYKE
jgi:hypothetical protein